MSSVKRRVFLQILGSATLVGCGGGGGSTPLPTTAPTASGLAVGQIAAMPGTSAFVARDANGIYAFSSICTHEGCDMRTSGGVKGSQILCSCHGSRFDANGNVLQGPARTALDHFKVTVNGDDTIAVDTSTVVSASIRVT